MDKQPEENKNSRKPKREIDRNLDRLERMIETLRIRHEQYFVDVVQQPPTKLRKETDRFVRELLKAPFKQSQHRFRLRSLIHRYETYATYWQRVYKQREEGTYHRDVFKMELRAKLAEDLANDAKNSNKKEKGMQQLFKSYESAIKKSGGSAADLNYDAFRKSLINKAKQLKKQHGVKRLNYKIVVKNGKVSVKASKKEN